MVSAKLQVHGAANFVESGDPEYKLLNIEIPEAIVEKREEILLDLKDALTAYGGGGVHATENVTNVTFDF